MPSVKQDQCFTNELYFWPIDLTRLFGSKVTIPSRRYQIPSLVRQTSSASIFPPVLNTITDLPVLPPDSFVLVETGPVLVDEWAVAVLIEGDLVVASTVGSGDAVCCVTATEGVGDSAVSGWDANEMDCIVACCEVVRRCNATETPTITIPSNNPTAPARRIPRQLLRLWLTRVAPTSVDLVRSVASVASSISASVAPTRGV